MKKIRDIIDMILYKFMLWSFLSSICIVPWLICLSISSSITEKIFNIRFEWADFSYFSIFILYFGGMLFFLLFLRYNTNEKDEKKLDDSGFKAYLIMFCLSFLLNIFFGEPIKENNSSDVPNISYTPRKNYYSDYSSRDSHANSNYRSSEPSNYAPPAKNSYDVTISHAPLPKNEKISENESSIPSNYDEDTQKIDIKHENEENHSTSSEIGLYDSWEYVTSDEYGNIYYINRNFGIYNTTTSFEGTIFYALFRKVFNNGGREVEVPTYDINKGMITEKKILAYEESIIRFRNENGLKEINFSSITGYTADNSVIIGYEIDNDDNIFRWKTINNEVYSALYDYVISR